MNHPQEIVDRASLIEWIESARKKLLANGHESEANVLLVLGKVIAEEPV